MTDNETAVALAAMNREELANAWSEERIKWETCGDYSTRRMLLIVIECGRRGIAPWLPPSLRRKLAVEAARQNTNARP